MPILRSAAAAVANVRSQLQFAVAASLVGVLAVSAVAAKPGSGGSGTTSPPPPVRYQTVWLGPDPAHVFDINGRGEIVGWFIGGARFNLAMLAIVDAASGTAAVVDLNTLGSSWVDLQDGTPTTGWIARAAYGINEGGWVVGRAHNADEFKRAFLYVPDETRLAGTFYLLPPVLGFEADETIATEVNNFGEVVGCRYQSGQNVFSWNSGSGTLDLGVPSTFQRVAVNNTGVVITGNSLSFSSRSSYRYELSTGALDLIAGVSMPETCINDMGMLAGERLVGSRAEDVELIRFSNPSLSDVQVIDKGRVEARAINGAGSVLYSKEEIVKRTSTTSLRLYDQSRGQIFNVNSLADQSLGNTGYPAAMSESNPLCDPDATGFGLIASQSSDTKLPFVLIPRKP